MHLIFKITSQQWVIDFFLGFELHTWGTSFTLPRTTEVLGKFALIHFSLYILFLKIDLNFSVSFLAFIILNNYLLFSLIFFLYKKKQMRKIFSAPFLYMLFSELTFYSQLEPVIPSSRSSTSRFWDRNEECKLQKLEHAMIPMWKKTYK